MFRNYRLFDLKSHCLVRSFLVMLMLQLSCRVEHSEPLRKFSSLREVPFQYVRINDDFWNVWMRAVQGKTIPDLLKIAAEEGWIDNFLIIAGRKEGKISLKNSPDSDLYKLLEAISYSLIWNQDTLLEKQSDEIIGIIADAQDEDGYINTQYQLPFEHPASPQKDNERVKKFGYGPEQRWKAKVSEWPKGIGQLYCAGHLFEAATTHYRATGKKNFLEIAIRLADCIDRQTDRNNFDYADHPQVEIGLIKLYQVTGRKRYLELADFIAHNSHYDRPPDIGDGENLKPVRDQKSAFGHCVRTMYLYSGLTDLFSYKGYQQDLAGLLSLWHSVAGRKMYITGGIGNGTEFEQHGLDWDLPNFSAYCECCGSISMGQWNHRLNLVTGNSKYADLVEIETYNGALSGLSLDGMKYAYRNVLSFDSRHVEWGMERWRYLFCCPSKLPGFIAGLNRWIYAMDDEAVYANLFVGNETEMPWKNDTLRILEKTSYPWDGQVSFDIDPGKPENFTFAIRIPGWVGENPVPGGIYRYKDKKPGRFSLKVNDAIIEPVIKNGYMRISRRWEAGDRIDLSFILTPRKVIASPEVKENDGLLAVMRGPVVYCMERIDNPAGVFNIALSGNEEFVQWEPDSLLKGTVALAATGYSADSAKIPVRLIPYFMWGNRGRNDMTVWIPYRLSSVSSPG